jgi:LytR cell envelope-related transcriptional attenuator
MRKSWPFALVVIVVGGLAGVAIAGRPVPNDPFVLDPSITVPIADSTPTTLAPTTTTSEPAATTTSTIETTTTVAPTTTIAAASTTTVTPASTAASTTTTVAGPVPRNQVRLVLANGDGRFRLASTTADRIDPLGYITDLGDTVQTVGATIVYYRPGFDDEAEIVAKDIGVPNAVIAALPSNASQAVTDSDDRGDVIVLLGPDAPR